jgi:predicted ATPase
MFKKIFIESWRQFENIEIEFHERLTILTGANGAGKTTILNILNQHFGWNTQLVGVAKKDKETGGIKYFSGIWNILKEKFKEVTQISNPHHPPHMMHHPGALEIGFIEYINGQTSKIKIPSEVESIFNILIENQQSIRGFNIPSHRPVYKYSEVHSIPTKIISKEEAYNKYRSSQVNRYFGHGGGQAETFHIKETLISLATFGYGNASVSPNSKGIEAYEGFINILKTVLPEKIGFQSISIRVPEVIFVTKSGEFPIDAVSGGLASIIDLAWQVYMFNDESKKMVVSFDEPENHLHPEMQKTILPNFLKAFPNIQFIIATHSPFIISSVPDSNVYALIYDSENVVKSVQLKDFEKSGTANEILRNALGIESTSPKWVDEKIDLLIQKYSSKGVHKENIEEFKNELSELDLSNYISESVISLIVKAGEKN